MMNPLRVAHPLQHSHRAAIVLLCFTLALAFDSHAQSPAPTTIFTPRQSGTKAYISWLSDTKKSLQVAAYVLTNDEIVDKYIELSKNKVQVQIIMDLAETKAIAKEADVIKRLTEAGCEVTVTTSPSRHQIMHAKYTIKDSIAVEDGSWNYSGNADYEVNTLNFSSDPESVKAFQMAWLDLHSFGLSQEMNNR